MSSRLSARPRPCSCRCRRKASCLRPPSGRSPIPSTYAPDLAERLTTSELRDVVPRYTADRQLLLRFYTVPGSLARLDATARLCRRLDQGARQARLRQAVAGRQGRLHPAAQQDPRPIANRSISKRSSCPASPRSRRSARTSRRCRKRGSATQFVTPDAAVQAIAALTARVKDTLAAASAGTLQVPESAPPIRWPISTASAAR